MTVAYWPTALARRFLTGLDFSPVDVKAIFEPDLGEPIARPRTTGAPFIAEARFVFDGDEVAAFKAFYATTLSQGSIRFSMRDPITQDVRMWRFLRGIKFNYPIKTIMVVQGQLMMLPGDPWFGPYVPAGVATIPAFVADYENEVYGIDGVRTAASAMPTIEGTYLVERTVSGVVSSTVEVLTAGDIPATAPVSTTRILGFAT